MNPPPFSLRRFARAFPDSHSRWYVATKVATDPLYPAVLAALRGTAGPLLDLGCGMGVLSFYLRAHGFLNPIHGIDYDPRKIAAARHVLAANGARGLTFAQGDARMGLPEHAGSITILDILQYFPPDEQSHLLSTAAGRVRPGGGAGDPQRPGKPRLALPLYPVVRPHGEPAALDAGGPGALSHRRQPDGYSGSRRPHRQPPTALRPYPLQQLAGGLPAGGH